MKRNRKIWLGVLMVLLPFIIGCIVLFAMPYNARFRYYFPKDNCMAQAGLIYDRVHNNDKQVDIAFFGTSRTKDAINDSLLELHLGGGVDIMNMGYCRLGRNMPYILLKELYKTKDPRLVVLEVTEKENWDGHMDFAYLADSRDVLLPKLIFNDNLIEDIFKALVVRFESVKQKVLGQYNPPPIRTEDYGHKIDTTHVDAGLAKQQREEKVRDHKPTDGFTRWFRYKISFSYIDKFIALAHEHDAEVVFLYLPEYASIPVPEEAAFYKSRGRLLIPPDSLYQQEWNWKDTRHMNEYGAAALTDWISGQLTIPPR